MDTRGLFGAMLVLMTAGPLIAEPEVPPGFAVLGTRVPAQWENLTVPADWEPGKIEEDPGREMSRGNLVMPAVSAEDTARGFVVYPKNYCDLVYAESAPTERELAQKAIALAACPGEYEPFTVCVRALTELPALKGTMTQLIGPKASIPRNHVDVRTVRIMPRAYYWGGGRVEKKYVMRPVLLEKRESVKVPAGTTQQVWVTVKVPDDAPAGDYKAALRLDGGRGGSAEVPVTLRVLPFRLEEPDIIYAMYHLMSLAWPNCFHGRSGELKRHLIDMREHGMNSDIIYTPAMVEKKDGTILVDFSRRSDPDLAVTPEEAIQGYADVGMKKPIIWITTGLGPDRRAYASQAEYEKDFLEGVKRIEQERRKRGWPELIYTPDDESDASHERAEACRQHTELLKRAGVRTYMTIVGTPERQLYLPHTDIPAYAALIFRAEFIDEARRLGKTLGMYNGGGHYGLNPKIDRLWYGMWNAKIGAGFLTSWTYQWIGGPASRGPFDAFCGMPGNGAGYFYSFPTTDGLLPSIGWEGVREGIDDQKYHYTLQRWIARARKSGNARSKELADQAETDIRAMLEPLDINRANVVNAEAIRTQSNAMTGADLDRFREGCIRHILTLQGEVGQ
jgi:hypothetical protein